MKVNEAKAKKKAFEDEIFRLAVEFEQVTGMSVIKIKVNRKNIGSMEDPEKTMLDCVEVDALL
ncbi:MAG: hypothetical protein JEY79_13980 [Pseudodesulfovibrio sp.]|nr:hypothetical protein [Pseudodesulfovibrio sp.]